MRLPKPDIVHKDDAILIVNKPAGVPVLHGNSPTLCEMVDGLTGARRRRMRVAHMIDDACSGGVLYVAMRDSEDSPRDQTHPETSYLALVEGVFDEAAARTGETISAPVSRSSGLGATPSTHIRVVDSGNGLSLVQVRARPDLPGQVREHLALIKHSIVGDNDNGSVRDDVGRLAMHALQIRITHPEDDKPQRYKIPAPASFWHAIGKPPPPDAMGSDMSKKDEGTGEQGWDHVAGWYDNLIQDRGSDHHQRVILPGIIRMLDLQPGEKVLDVACGQGIVSEHIVHMKDVDSVLGVDASEKLIEAANSRSTQRTQYQVHDAEQLESLETEFAPFDAAVCVMALMNIDDLEAVMRGVFSKLRPGGRFVCVISHPAFRVMGGSAWGWAHDERTTQPVQFRRVDQYLGSSRSRIVMNPGEVAQGKPAITTTTHNRPMSAYINAGTGAGLLVRSCEEWTSNRESEPGPRAKAENHARKEIPLFMALRFDKPLADG
jgi:ubiquinone/menaquinone biosynthesis C-methylase UbiE